MTIDYHVKEDTLEGGETSVRKGVDLDLHLSPSWSKAGAQ